MKKLYLLFFLLMCVLYASSYTENIRMMVFHTPQEESSLPVDSIDSITFPDLSGTVLVSCKSGKTISIPNINSFDIGLSTDTLFLHFIDDSVKIHNPQKDLIDVIANNADVKIYASAMPSLVICANGHSEDGSIQVTTDTTFKIRLDSLFLKSAHTPALYSTTKQKFIVELADGTTNKLEDAETYVLADSLEKANACLYANGHIDFTGKGILNIVAKCKHGIASDKGIRFKEGHISVLSAPADAIHSGKYISLEGGMLTLDGQEQDGMDAKDYVSISSGKAQIKVIGEGDKAIKCDGTFLMEGGNLNLNLLGNSSKGIKSKSNINISGGRLDAIAKGGITIQDGDPSYCTIIKGDADLCISGGELSCVNNSAGGRCITSDGNMAISGGNIYTETNGDGAEYINTKGETDYYTSKCISADGMLSILYGTITCLSTGLGGKGIVADTDMVIGSEEKNKSSYVPKIDVTTKGTSIINDVNEDMRFGCPKGIKVNNILNVYDGDIKVQTEGMGGEGIECNNEFYFHDGQLECNCFDDGINVGNKIEIFGGHVYCMSIDNDGIDSNGSINIKGGLVASVNLREPNESFDAENRQFNISGGMVIGIGSSSVKMDREEQLYYNTLYNVDPSKPARRGLRLTTGKYLYVMDGNKLLLSLKNDNTARRGFVTLSLPELIEYHNYSLFQGDIPSQSTQSYFGGKLFIEGVPTNEEFIIDFQPMYNYND